jgi:hypothetical protein
MGTNFFWIVDGRLSLPTGDEVPIDRDDPSIHLGKRSAAGRYCWDDNVTLAVGGLGAVHSGRGMLDACPVCGKPFVVRGAPFRKGPAAVELGFAEPETVRPTGVGAAASFSWAQDPIKAKAVLERNRDTEVVEDEYGRRYTGGAFLTMLEANCPMEFTDSIGRSFS